MKQKIIVFGRGRYFRKKKASIEKIYEIIGFIDNAVKIETEEIYAEELLPIYNPKELANFPNDTLIVIASVKFFEMWKQLLHLGVEEERIIFATKFLPYIDELEKIFEEERIIISSKNKKMMLTYKEQDIFLETEEEYKAFLRKVYYDRFPYIKAIADMPLNPVSKRFAQERGGAIDRVYIEKFLETYKDYISGDVMEIAETRYIEKFGESRVQKSYALHVNGWGEGVIKGNLVTGEGIKEDMVDCLICTQTLPFIYDLHSCVKNIYKLLRSGGKALITCSYLAQLAMYDYENWGEYWGITDQSLRKLLEESFSSENIEIVSYGNMKTAIAFLYGLCAEDLDRADFEYNDVQYPMIVAAVVKK